MRPPKISLAVAPHAQRKPGKQCQEKKHGMTIAMAHLYNVNELSDLNTMNRVFLFF
jgi:hypothetical protein